MTRRSHREPNGVLSYDVRLWKTTQYKGKKRTTYTVRWTVDGQEWRRTFANKAQAQSYHARLLSATRSGEAFDCGAGLPVIMLNEVPTKPEQSWYHHACAFVDMKWPRAAAKTRVAIADALATVTPVLVVPDTTAPNPRLLRRALYGWAFNAPQRGLNTPPDDLARTIDWLEHSTRPLSSLNDAAVLRSALDALAATQDGKPAATNTFLRKRAVFHNALEYAVELGHLQANPLTTLNWTPPRAAEPVDPRVLIDRRRAEALLKALAELNAMGKQLVAFFACMYYAALRPAEAVQLRDTDIRLPSNPGDWGELYLHRSSPAVARRWTNSGQRREARQLKHRAEEEVRPVPCHPRLVELLRAHLDEFGTTPDGRLFRARYRNMPPSESVYGRIWQKARARALSPAEAASPMARRPYDLRHACLTTWLNAGVDPAQVAEWAGHSVTVLLRVYVRCIVGRDEIAKKRIERALDDETQT